MCECHDEVLDLQKTCQSNSSCPCIPQACSLSRAGLQDSAICYAASGDERVCTVILEIHVHGASGTAASVVGQVVSLRRIHTFFRRDERLLHRLPYHYTRRARCPAYRASLSRGDC